MKKEFTTIHSAAFAMMLAASVNCALAQETSTTSIWGNRGQYTTEDTNSEEEALLQSLYTDEDAEAIAQLFPKEEFIFSNNLRDNWHAGLYLGLMNSWGSYDSEVNVFKRANFAAALSFGKYISPYSDVRFQFFYGRGTGVRGADNKFDAKIYPYNLAHEQGLADFHTYNWHTFGFSAQYLPNLTNFFLGYNPERKYTISALAGIGLEHTWSYTEKELSIVSVWAEKAKSASPRNLVDLEFGLVFDCKIAPRLYLSVEAIDRFLDDTFDGLISDQKWDGHLDLLVGLTYLLPHKTQTFRPEIRKEPAVVPVIENLTEKIVTEVNVDKDVIYTLISFDKGTVEVPRLQQNNVYQTAQAYLNTPKSNIFITNSNKLDDKTFHQRAWAISKLLHQRWQIPYEKIWVDCDEDHIQKLQLPDVKSYIIFIINEE